MSTPITPWQPVIDQLLIVADNFDRIALATAIKTALELAYTRGREHGVRETPREGS